MTIQLSAADLAEIRNNVQVERPVIISPWVGRCAGVAGGLASAAVDMINGGIRPSNVIGGIVGAGVGYYAGYTTDLISGATSAITRSKGSNISGGLVAFGIGYGTSVGVRTLARGADNIADRYSSNDIEIDTNVPNGIF